MNASSRKLFLIDAFGAFLSACMLGIVLIKFNTWFGMPKFILTYLSIAVLMMALFSLACYLIFPSRWQVYLKSMALVNGVYCCCTVGLMLFYRSELTALGWTYFIIECVIILLLVQWEWKVSKVQ